MIKLKALNHDLSSDDDAPTIRKEAQEEITLDLYNKALRLQCQNEHEESIQILKQLLDENIPQLQSQGGLPTTMSTIKYSCYINIGAAFIKLKNREEALKFYLQGSELDGTDVTLWYKIGILALQLDRFNQSAVAFINGLHCNEEHWPCLDNLISVLYVVENYLGCLEYIQKALQLERRYMKGLVLRKHIYTSTPSISIFFPTFNPDEQDLNQYIDSEKETIIMKNIDSLSERLLTVQKNLISNKIVEVPLPKPLENYTWIHLGNTVTSFHQYITCQRLSHFSTIQALNDQSPPSIVENYLNRTLEEPNLANEANLEVSVTNCDFVVSDDNVVRRLSINSETDRDKDTTPNQTDNDEMEQDTEDQDDLSDQKKDEKTKTQVRSTKRKRDLLSDLQIWGWHSKRKQSKKGKFERELTVEEALTRIIPAQLLPNGLNEYNQNDDSTVTTEMYNLHIEANKPTMKLISPIGSPACSESSTYFYSELEKSDVMRFWTEQSQNDSVNQIIEFVQKLATKWDEKWPSELVPIYIDAYNMYREHYIISPMSSTLDFETIYNDAMSTILYAEFILFHSKRGKIYLGDDLRKVDTSTILFLETCAVEKLNWAEKYTNYVVRVFWLKAHVLQNYASNKLAIHSLKLLSDVMHMEEENVQQVFALRLPNCEKSNVITMDIITKLVKKIGMIDSVNRLETLFTAEHYHDVIEIVKMTFSYNHPVKHRRVDRPAQLGMFLYALKCTDRTECFVWAEICLYEALGQYMKSDSDKRWEMIVLECLEVILDTVRSETVSAMDILPEASKCRFVKSLSILCSQQVNCDGLGKLLLDCVIPWILLHYVILREEHRQQAKKIVRHIITDEDKSKNQESSDEDDIVEIPASVAILFSAHEFLGPKACCVIKQGELLHFILDTVVDRLDTPIFERLRERIDIHLEQAFFCLYQHPSKKNKISRHLADHNVDPLPLTWARAQQLYAFFCPTSLPEFDSYKSISISAELEQLLQRICSLVPTDCDPNPLVGRISEFVRGITETLPQPIQFPNKVRSMYYLLGDFYFKQSEVKRSYRYFLLDLCINTDRVDTWACIALGNASQLEGKLNHCERFKSEQEFLDKARSTRVCFQRALHLTTDHATLWIEFGSFEYMAHSFCSRLLKCESETLSMERFEMLENKKEDFLKKSQFNFTKALELYQPDQNDADERWLYYYILGKIAEKQHKEPNEYLQHYLTAQTLLHENKATYPEKINYNNPQHLSLEALELHYRINSSILKYLELHEGKPIPTSIGKVFRKCLEESLFLPDKIEPHVEVKPPDLIPEKMTEVFLNETEIIILASHEKPSASTPDINVGNNMKLEENPAIVPSVKTEVKEVNLGQNQTVDAILIKEVKDVLSPPNVVEDIKIAEEIKVETPMDVVTENIKESNSNIAETTEIVESGAKSQENIAAATVTISNTIPPENYSDPEPQTTLLNLVGSTTQLTVDPTQKTDPLEPLELPVETISSKPTTPPHVATAIAATGEESSSSSSSSSSSDSDSDDSSSSSSSSTTSSATSEATTSAKNFGNMSDHEISNLMDRCLLGLEQCIKRLPQNYKALYRIAHLHFAYKKKRDLNKCKQLFLTEYKCKNGTMVSGLFADRKPSNFFNGVWRIPSSEIDRPGSLAAHMARCVSLLLQALRDTHDHRTLLDLCILLRRVPDPDKVYVRHAERDQLAEQSFAMYVQALRALIRALDQEEQQGKGKTGAGMHVARERLLGDVYRGYQRVQKMSGGDDGARVMGGMLTEIYKKLMMDIRLPDNINILDLALKYCQQSRAADKLKKQQAAKTNLPNYGNMMASTNTPLAVTPSSNTYFPTSSSPSPVILSSSSSAAAAASAAATAYLAGLPSSLSSSYPRRPTLGRPRGRPPGPKLPTVPKGPRGRPPLNPQAQQSAYSFPFYPSGSYDYAKKYQEELLRQYSQMTQNPYMTTSASLLNANLVQHLNTMATMTTAANSLSTASLTAGLGPLATNPMTTFAGTSASQQQQQQLMQYFSAAMRLPTTSATGTSSSITDTKAALINMAAAALLQSTSKSSLSGLGCISSTFSGLGGIPSTSSTLGSIPSTSSYSGVSSSSISGLMRGSSGFKTPSGEIGKGKGKESNTKTAISGAGGGVAGNIPVKELLKQVAMVSPLSSIPSYKKLSSYILPPDLKPKLTPKTTSASILKDRPSISITPIMSHIPTQSIHTTSTCTSPAILTPIPGPSPPLSSSPSSITSSPGKTLQEKLAEKQKQQQQMMNAQQLINKKLDFTTASAPAKQTSTLGTLSVSTTMGSSKPPLKVPKTLDVLPAFSRDGGVTISTVSPNAPNTTHSPKHSPKSIAKPSMDRAISLSVIKNPEEKQEIPMRKDSSDDDVILIE